MGHNCCKAQDMGINDNLNNSSNYGYDNHLVTEGDWMQTENDDSDEKNLNLSALDVEVKREDVEFPFLSDLMMIGLKDKKPRLKEIKDKHHPKPETRHTYIMKRDNEKFYLRATKQTSEQGDGYVKLLSFTGDYFEGIIKNFRLKKGLYIFANGEYYFGKFKNNLFEGKGEYICLNGDKYFGNFSKSEKSGKGRIEWNDGSSYEGFFKNNVKHGFGEYFYYSGDHYKGEFFNGKKEGRGVYSWNDGRVYDGEWNEDLMNGKGRFVYKNGDEYEGDWVDNYRHGLGVLTLNNGDSYQGQWIDNHLEGEVIKKGENNRETKELWKNGKKKKVIH